MRIENDEVLGPFNIGSHNVQVWSANHKLICNIANYAGLEVAQFILDALNEKWERDHVPFCTNTQ